MEDTNGLLTGRELAKKEKFHSVYCNLIKTLVKRKSYTGIEVTYIVFLLNDHAV